eukprot:gene14005-2048_t
MSLHTSGATFENPVKELTTVILFLSAFSVSSTDAAACVGAGVASTVVTVSGACDGYLNAAFTLQGNTADGREFFHLLGTTTYMYFDTACGVGHPSKWIISPTTRPSTTAARDLPGDGNSCVANDWVASTSFAPPATALGNACIVIQGLKDEGKPAEEMLSKGYEAVDLYKCGYSHAEIQEGEEAFSGAPASTTDYICDLLKANLKLEGSKLKDHDREKLCRSATGLAVAVTFVLLFFGVAGFVSRTYRSGKMPKMDPFDDAGGDSIGMMINPMASPGLVSGSTAVVDSMANPMYGIAEANQVLYAVPMDLKSNNNETKRRLGNPTNDTAAANEVLYAIPMDQEDDA